jgi:hypothetical protein
MGLGGDAARPTRKDAFGVLSVLDTELVQVMADEKIVKADGIQDFVCLRFTAVFEAKIDLIVHRLAFMF